MSFLARTAARTLPRAAVGGSHASRAFGSTAVQQKAATETVKDTLKTVDRAVADKIVDGIELGESATEKVKETTGLGTSEAKGKASELAGAAQGKASELSGEAKGAANEMAGKAKGMKEEAKGEIKGRM